MAPSVSIITPCYNGSAHIDTCVRSVIAQTYKDWELILIDDGSTDASMSICQHWAKEDSRIRAIRKKNGGVSSARNDGIELASGKWITFLDVDDTLPADSLECLIKHTTNPSVDIVFCGYNTIKDGVKIPKRPPIKNITLDANELCLELFCPKDYPYNGYVWARLFKHEILDKYRIRFNENIIYNEDRLFAFSYLLYSKFGAYSTKPVYNYIQVGNSAMASINGPDYWKFETDLDAFLIMCQMVPDFRSPQLKDAVYHGTYLSYLRNRRLNKEFGGNNKGTNSRLKRKLYSAVPKNKIFEYKLNNNKYWAKERLYNLAVKLGLK